MADFHQERTDAEWFQLRSQLRASALGESFCPSLIAHALGMVREQLAIGEDVLLRRSSPDGVNSWVNEKLKDE
jgi:hypothetical protein